MSPREQFLADLGTWALYVAVAYLAARFALGFARAIAAEIADGRRQSRRLAVVLEDPLRYCLLGHLHSSRADAADCEAAHGIEL